MAGETEVVKETVSGLGGSGLGGLGWAGVGASVLGAGMGYLQYRKGVKQAKKIDEMGMESFADAQLPEYKEVENRYKKISEQGLEQPEVNEFMRSASAATYAQQLNAKTMAGGSLARYTLALNNANMIAGIGTLAANNFQRKMVGLQGYTGQLDRTQNRVDQDIQMENQRRLQGGAAAAGLAQQGGQNMVGALGSLASTLVYSGAGSKQTDGQTNTGETNTGETNTGETNTGKRITDDEWAAAGFTLSPAPENFDGAAVERENARVKLMPNDVQRKFRTLFQPAKADDSPENEVGREALTIKNNDNSATYQIRYKNGSTKLWNNKKGFLK